ncbi:DUF3649 domain-containing protein [Catenovulum agarivorans]|uniref:DUF3649 domain-containing protein n=1 Tax=Catenovulum agarivorans TaxID=1172192 RepID=UPI0002E31614|nr:DUF3649 domain-containing protein [Catenovulum agarivorans]
MSLPKQKSKTLDVSLRVFTALVAGFVFANQSASLIAYYLPSANTVDNIVAGKMLSFIVWALVVIYVFAAKSAKQTFVLLLLVCAVALAWMSHLELVFKS